MKSMEATRLSMITLVIPVVALALGRVLLGESVSATATTGVAVVLAGVAIAIVPVPAKLLGAACLLLLAGPGNPLN
jgi:drug/metabolite transporter (DMT)-like permease